MVSCGSDKGMKFWKRCGNRSLRQLSKTILRMNDTDAVNDGEVFPILREASNIWGWPRDGRALWVHNPEFRIKALRK